MLKTLKRKIALVAVSALGAGGLSIVAAPVANALTGASQAATVTPVRVSFTGTTRDAVPAANITFTNNSGAQIADGGGTNATISLTQAPSSTAEVTVTLPGGDTLVDTLGGGSTNRTGSANILATNFENAATLTSTIAITAAPASGTYRGTITLSDAQDDITVTFSFTTSGAPASISVDKEAVSLASVSAAVDVVNRAFVDATGVATITTGAPHGFAVGNIVSITGGADAAAQKFQGNKTIASVPSATTFTFVDGAVDAADIVALGADLAGRATATSFVVSQDVVVSLKDASGNGTQIGTGDTLTVSVADATNIAIQAAALGTSLTISDANLADNSHTVRIGSLTTTADTETVTVTPNGVLPGLGVVAKTLTATSVAYGATTSAVTTVTSPSSSSVILKNASAAQSDYSIDPGTATIIAETSGLEAGKAYRIGVLVTDGGGAVQAGTYSVAGATAAAFTNGTVSYSYGIAPSTGKVQTVIVFTTLMNNAADTVQINVSTGDTDYTDTSDLLVTSAASAYTTTLTAPATTPSVALVGATTPVAGTIADQYGNAFIGATVTIVGTQTLSAGTASPLTAQAVTDSAGKFSVTLGAVNALTTSLALTIDATRGGVSATQKTATVNFNAGGAATDLTFLANGDEDTALTATYYPNIVVPFDDGVVSGVSNEVWAVATGAASGDNVFGGDGTVALDATDECVALDIQTTPLAQVTATGSAGVLFSDTLCAAQKVSDLKSTITVASKTHGGGLDTLWVTSTKTGKNTVTLTSGAVTKTVTFYAQNWLAAANKGDAARDIVLDSATKSLTGGEIGFVTATVVDTFGNAVEQAAARSTVRAAITGAALLDGPSLSKSGLVGDADGKITLGVIAGNAAGTATLTVTGVNVAGGQFGALVGTATSTTLAGTNTAFKASANVKTATITVSAGSSKTDTEVAAVKADVKAVSDTVKTLSNAVTTIQSSVTELTSSFSAQIKSLSSAIAKISRAIAALSKRIR